MGFQDFPRVPLLFGPSPVHRLERLSQHLGGKVDIWAKREDCNSGLAFGGNKVRKLEYLLGEARAVGAGRLITTGVVGSHHCLATSVHGRRVGLPTTIVVFPQPMTEHAREVAALNEAWADEVCRCGTFATQPFVAAAVRWRRRGDRPYVIPGGGSSPVGALGYVAGALELAAQVRTGEAPRPDAIWVAAGTLGTVAGLAVGTAMTGLTDRIVGVRIVPSAVGNELVLGRLVEGVTARLREAGVPVPDPRRACALVTLNGAYLGAGYGHPTDAGSRAAEWFAERGVALDPTYTAKTGAAVLDGLDSDPRSVHLYWHTLSATEPGAPA
jgi:D-cysteine desulfhydrase